MWGCAFKLFHLHEKLAKAGEGFIKHICGCDDTGKWSDLSLAEDFGECAYINAEIPVWSVARFARFVLATAVQTFTLKRRNCKCK